MRSRISFIAIIVILAAAMNAAQAEWGPSTQVEELNSTLADDTPFLSYDGLTMYFSRFQQGTYHTMYQATRNNTLEDFSNVTQILSSSGGHLCFPWVSADNKRMYYQSTQSGSWKINFTERTSATAAWQLGSQDSKLAAINAYGAISSMSLSLDEKTALFSAVNGSTWTTYIATRADKDSAFGNVISVANNSADAFLMPDALSAYYVWGDQLYKLSRATTSDLFENAGVTAGFDQIRMPTLSADGQTLYWCKRNTQPNGQVVSDIYVSHFIPEPATMLLLGAGAMLFRRKLA